MSQISLIKKRINQLARQPISEADTCRLIVEPILQWLEYDVHDWDVIREQVTIQEGSSKGNDGRADYGVLVNSVFTFMIEAKKLGTNSLNDTQEIKKALDYCAHKDRPRFAILTDGRIWVIFDNEVGGTPSSREFLRVDILENEQPLRILRASFLTALLTHCDLIRDIKISNLKMQNVVLEMLIRRMLEDSMIDPQPQLQPQLQIQAPPQQTFTDGWKINIQTQDVTGTTPLRLFFKEASRNVYVSKWTSVLFEIFKYLSTTRAKEMSVLKRPRGGQMFPAESLNYKSPQNVSANPDIPLIFEMNGSAEELVSKLVHVLKSMAISFDAVEIFCS